MLRTIRNALSTKNFKKGRSVSYDYDLFVIGAGSGGVRASRIASQLGANVAVAEDRYLGGTCVNVGCVPKKLFVYASEFSKSRGDAKGFGWELPEGEFSWPTLLKNKDSEIHRLNGIYGNILENAGVEILHGKAKIEGPNEVSVEGVRYTAKNILIATGGWPTMPSFPGAEYTFNSNDAFHLKSLPKRILVQGGGYIAVEFAGIFKGLGCETELVYRGPLFLRGFDKEVREFVAEEVEKSGVRISFNADIESISKNGDGSLAVTLSNGETREVDAVMSAIGRKAKTDGLGLENASIECDESGFIKVNDHYQTSCASIYALGDVIGKVALTPVALAEGMALANNLFGEGGEKVNYEYIPTAVFCQPNIGTLGVSEEEAQDQGVSFDVYTSAFRPLKNTISGSPSRMFMKLLVEQPTNKVIGAHIVGPEAGEMIQGLAVAVKAGATKGDFDSTIGVHPTAAEEFVTMRSPIRRY